MTFDQLWAIVEERNPGMVKNGSATVTLTQFKKAMKMAYEQGAREERINIATMAKSHGMQN